MITNKATLSIPVGQVFLQVFTIQPHSYVIHSLTHTHGGCTCAPQRTQGCVMSIAQVHCCLQALKSNWAFHDQILHRSEWCRIFILIWGHITRTGVFAQHLNTQNGPGDRRPVFQVNPFPLQMAFLVNITQIQHHNGNSNDRNPIEWRPFF